MRLKLILIIVEDQIEHRIHSFYYAYVINCYFCLKSIFARQGVGLWLLAVILGGPFLAPREDLKMTECENENHQK